MKSAHQLVRAILEMDEDPKDFIERQENFFVDFPKEEQRAAVLQVAICVYLWLVQDFREYVNVDDFIGDLAMACADHATADLGVHPAPNDTETARAVLAAYFRRLDMGEVLENPRLHSRAVANLVVKAFMDRPETTIDPAERLRRMRARRGEAEPGSTWNRA
jgi:hypothetical protein